MNVSDTLNLAADLIEERGWARGEEGWSVPTDDGGRSNDGPLCLEGAIAAAMGKVANIGGGDGIWPDEINTCSAGAAVRAYLAWHPSIWLCGWNDQSDRTATEVVEVLRATALIESAREREAAEVSR